MKVSVVMITYNHEPYIREAINGVLMQKINFELELIIADDCSTDDTVGVVKDVIANHTKSSLIKYTRHQKNKGMMGNFIWALNQCSGEYIALCEGDDYWIDPYKLQKQVDFLFANPDYSICAHNVEVLTEQNSNKTLLPDLKCQREFTFNQYIENNFVGTCSLLFLSKPLKSIPRWFKRFEFGDWALILHSLKQTEMKLIILSEPMGVYRIHEGGVYGKNKNHLAGIIINYKKHIRFYNLIKKYIISKNQKDLIAVTNKRRNWYYDHLLNLCIENRLYKQFFSTLFVYTTTTFQIRRCLEYLFILLKKYNAI
jgi:glycosyltransferase involved in cell wall biosynthesis